ncbi:BAG domain-containing protein [Mycena sanguinolenta]|uniref:BAG domain-containing protein n=1 Tax=Mycena sanguinolenta TaxID=230812 RepID=A0A8H6YUF4_9AGAR|nr:BAG domain-containing protein [Mycena sanguinolenta]
MFHQSYPSVFPSYRTPVPRINPREKYLAALAEAKAAEAEYLAVEQLQQEENQLRQRLEQIQSLKHQPNAYYTHTPAPHYPQTTPFDLEALRRQIAAEERARIVREQELEALRVQEAQRKARELEALRIHEARKAQQVARDIERSRTLAAQRAEFEALPQHALVPTVRLVASEDTNGPSTRHGCSRRCASYPEFRNSLEIPSLVTAKRPQHTHDCGCERKAHKVRFAPDSTAKEAKPAVKAPRTVSLDQLLQHALGGHTAPQPQTQTKPQEAAPQRQVEVITLDQLLGHFLGAAGVDGKQSQRSTSKTATAASGPSVPAPKPATKPALAPAASQPPRPTGLEHFLHTVLGAASPQSNQPNGVVEIDLQQLLNTLFGGAARPSAPAKSQAGPSKSAAPSTTNDSKPAVKKSEQEEREERELAEAIRLSLADTQSSSTASESKGKAPAPAPVKDVASSTAEVHAIDASFTALANEFVFPLALDFSTSRTASPTRNATAEESVIAKLSYNTQNQPVRFYHQALTGLLARLDAVESFGDEGLRHERKAVVERVEGAMDEVERVVEGKWRKWAGKDRADEATPAAETEPVVASEEKDAPTAPADSEPEQSTVPEPSSADSEPAPAPEPISEHDTVPEPSPAVEETQSASSSYPPEPASAAESVATLHPLSPAPAFPVPSSPVPSSTVIDTFLLPRLIH